MGTDHYFKGKKTDFSFNYNFAHAREVTKYTDVTNFFENGSPSTTWEANQEFLLQRKKHNFSAFFDYQLSERSQLSLSAITIWQPDVSRDYKTFTDIEGDQMLSGFDTYNFSTSKYINTSYYLDFEQQLNDAGAEISFNGHYTFYDTTKGQALETDFFDTTGNFTEDNDFLVNTEQYINLYSLQTDYATPISKSFKVETGLRYAGIASKNIVLQRGIDFETPGVNPPTDAGTFSYDEHIFAAYASVNGRWGDWKLKSGLRAEYTDTKGSWNQATPRTKTIISNFFLPFPSGIHRTTNMILMLIICVESLGHVTI